MRNHWAVLLLLCGLAGYQSAASAQGQYGAVELAPIAPAVSVTGTWQGVFVNHVEDRSYRISVDIVEAGDGSVSGIRSRPGDDEVMLEGKRTGDIVRVRLANGADGTLTVGRIGGGAGKLVMKGPGTAVNGDPGYVELEQIAE